MDLIALVPIVLVGLGFFWALWLIFKRNLLDQNLGKLVAYFIGVVITFAVIGWIIDTYLPQWTARRLLNARTSEDVQVIESVGRDIWEEAMGSPPQATVIVTTPVSQQPPVVITPVATSVPTNGTPAVSGQSLSGRNQMYTVVSGDTLSSLSRRFGVPINAIQQYNGLGTSTTIKVGQTLIIPVP